MKKINESGSGDRKRLNSDAALYNNVRRRARYRAGKISLTPLTPKSNSEIAGKTDVNRCFRGFVKKTSQGKFIYFNDFDE